MADTGGVINGQSVDATTTNAAFLPKNGNGTAAGIITLAEIASGSSGSQVDNVQAEQNSIASFVGKALNAAYNVLPTWASSFIGTASDNVMARIEAVILKFKATAGAGGHAHTGVDGDGAKISGADISSGAASSGQILMADGSGGASFQDAAGGGALVVSGTRSSPNLITAAGGVTSPNETRNLMRVSGSGGPVTVTANPQISVGTTDGLELILEGCDATNTLTLSNGNGLEQNGPVTLGLGDKIAYIWDAGASVWSETWRSLNA